MRRPLAAAAVGAAVAVLTLSGCGMGEDPCRDIPRADKAVVAAVAEHPEYEIETQGRSDAECILTPTGRWAEEYDSE